MIFIGSNLIVYIIFMKRKTFEFQAESTPYFCLHEPQTKIKISHIQSQVLFFHDVV